MVARQAQASTEERPISADDEPLNHPPSPEGGDPCATVVLICIADTLPAAPNCVNLKPSLKDKQHVAKLICVVAEAWFKQGEYYVIKG